MRVLILGDNVETQNTRSETYEVCQERRDDVPGRPIRHFRTIKNACLGCAKPVHLVRMSDGTYEWQHDGIPTAEMMERHRERGIGRQVVDTGRAVDLLEAARKGDVA